MSAWWFRLGLMRAVLTDLRLAVRLAREPQVSWIVKALPVAAVGYLVMPFDIVPDLLPVLGQADDLGVLLLAVKLSLRLCPAALVAFHRAQILKRQAYSAAPRGDGIRDAQFRRL